MIYAKLIEGVLRYAPRRIVRGDFLIYNPPLVILEQEGYKPVIHTEPPAVEENRVAVFGWAETEAAIIQTWTVEPEGDIPDEDVLEILLGGEGA